MNNGSFFIPREQIYSFFNPGEMNSEEGLYLFWETDPEVARRILPPPLVLSDPQHPVVSAYVVNIREPTFAPWYMEGGLMLLCRYGDVAGAYFLNLQLSGPGAVMGMCSGREFAGLPKKICERIVVERTGDWARAVIEAKGRRILDVEVELDASHGAPGAQLSQPIGPGHQARTSCFLFVYEGDRAADGHVTFPKMSLVNYDSLIVYQSWEPGRISAITLGASIDDPWAELAVVKPLGAAYSVNSNRDVRTSPLAQFEGADADRLISYLFSGRFDRSTICTGHQRYGQF